MLYLADRSAASHRLRIELQNQMTELDQLESQYQTLAAQRGWELPEDTVQSGIFSKFRFYKRSDSELAEYFIRLYTKYSIDLLKLYHHRKHDDRTVQSLFQKFMDRCTISIRQMQFYL